MKRILRNTVIIVLIFLRIRRARNKTWLFLLTVKAKLLGINVVIHEESYTSKIDHLAFEPLKKQESYLGKRKKRGLFQSSIGKLINADINGSIGIARKVIGDSFIGKIIDSGFVFNPIRVNTL